MAAPDRDALPDTDGHANSARRTKPKVPASQPMEPPAADSTGAPMVIRAGAGVLGTGTSGPAPRALLGGGLYGFVTFDRTSVLSVAVRLTVTHAWRNDIPEAGGRADFSLDGAGLDLCLLRLTAGPVTTRGCATGWLGRLVASGSDTYDPQSHGRLSAALGGAAVVTATLPAAFHVALALDVTRAVTRSEFAFNPQVFYRTPPLAMTLGVGVGRNFR